MYIRYNYLLSTTNASLYYLLFLFKCKLLYLQHYYTYNYDTHFKIYYVYYLYPHTHTQNTQKKFNYIHSTIELPQKNENIKHGKTYYQHLLSTHDHKRFLH